MVQRVKRGMVVVTFCILLIGCGEKKGKAPENASVPDKTIGMMPEQASTTKANTSIYKKTYVYHDMDLNSKAVPFRILKLDTKKTYKVPADEERLHLLDVADHYFEDLTKQEGLTKAEYSMDELEYVYELTGQLLYMPVYLRYRSGKASGEEVLYNLIIRSNKGTFELVGQTDRALLDEERYPRKRMVNEVEEEAADSYEVDTALYNQCYTEGERILNTTVRSYFLDQMKQYLKKVITAAEREGSIQIGVIDVVKYDRNVYFSLLELVFYDTNNNIKKIKRYQVVDPSGTLGEVMVSDLGAFDSMVEIGPDDMIVVDGRDLFEEEHPDEKP